MVKNFNKKRLNGDQNMLGEQIGSLTASTTNKPLPVDGAFPKFEVTATGSGALYGQWLICCTRGQRPYLFT
jgi:hypothetical protein